MLVTMYPCSITGSLKNKIGKEIILTYSTALQLLKGFGRPLMRASTSIWIWLQFRGRGMDDRYMASRAIKVGTGVLLLLLYAD
jgi:hypothetical protein